MMSESTTVDKLYYLDKIWWFSAILFFGVGDILTSYLGLVIIHPIIEVGPVAAVLVHKFNFGLATGYKFALLVIFYILYRVVPNPYSIGIPLGLSGLGVVVTAWNIFILSSVIH